jgi:hypothetical protein
MKANELGPFAVFRFKGRVYVKSAGIIQQLDRSGRYFEGHGALVARLCPDDEVEPFDFTAHLEGSACGICCGSGYLPGGWDAPLHYVTARTRCPNGCPVEGGEPEVVKRYVSAVCECCQQTLPECKAPVSSSSSERSPAEPAGTAPGQSSPP